VLKYEQYLEYDQFLEVIDLAQYRMEQSIKALAKKKEQAKRFDEALSKMTGDELMDLINLIPLTNEGHEVLLALWNAMKEHAPEMREQIEKAICEKQRLRGGHAFEAISS